MSSKAKLIGDADAMRHKLVVMMGTLSRMAAELKKKDSELAKADARIAELERPFPWFRVIAAAVLIIVTIGLVVMAVFR